MYRYLLPFREITSQSTDKLQYYCRRTLLPLENPSVCLRLRCLGRQDTLQHLPSTVSLFVGVWDMYRELTTKGAFGIPRGVRSLETSPVVAIR
jgi:hypothetical protein